MAENLDIIAIQALKDYLDLYKFVDTDGKEIPLQAILPQWPEPEHELSDNAISITVDEGGGENEANSLGPCILADTYDGRTVLVNYGEWVTRVLVEVIADLPRIRNEILGNLEVALNPDLNTFGLYLELEDYHDQTVEFLLDGGESESGDLDEALSGERRGMLALIARIPYVKKRNAQQLKLITTIDVSESEIV